MLYEITRYIFLGLVMVLYTVRIFTSQKSRTWVWSAMRFAIALYAVIGKIRLYALPKDIHILNTSFEQFLWLGIQIVGAVLYSFYADELPFPRLPKSTVFAKRDNDILKIPTFKDNLLWIGQVAASSFSLIFLATGIQVFLAYIPEAFRNATWIISDCLLTIATIYLLIAILWVDDDTSQGHRAKIKEKLNVIVPRRLKQNVIPIGEVG